MASSNSNGNLARKKMLKTLLSVNKVLARIPVYGLLFYLCLKSFAEGLFGPLLGYLFFYNIFFTVLYFALEFDHLVDFLDYLIKEDQSNWGQYFIDRILVQTVWICLFGRVLYVMLNTFENKWDQPWEVHFELFFLLLAPGLGSILIPYRIFELFLVWNYCRASTAALVENTGELETQEDLSPDGAGVAAELAEVSCDKASLDEDKEEGLIEVVAT